MVAQSITRAEQDASNLQYLNDNSDNGAHWGGEGEGENAGKENDKNSSKFEYDQVVKKVLFSSWDKF